MRTIEASEVLRERLIRREVLLFLQKSLGLVGYLDDLRLQADLHEDIARAERRLLDESQGASP